MVSAGDFGSNFQVSSRGRGIALCLGQDFLKSHCLPPPRYVKLLGQPDRMLQSNLR